ncbi:MAR binding filament-like protein 1, putative isoform 2 [Hibiscus syriacus]|uniref:MAR binding filament-like protein 1, putative isoform 2 n=1 Tax=Hibiscus syriacus TaxID=106335 RepID=A0A6A3ACI7_HIBSY|nr:MAR-binding filament-like protein 1-1 isoform X1 [Hibiscus syriacus]KAE8700642.1 MAR binding filament-like protein 1, putative isoform 2 [Hibiscus syriacus]
MGFVIGSSCYLQAPISNSQSVYFNLRNAESNRRRSFRPPMASLSHQDPNDHVSRKRRAVLLVGISILPLLQLRANALDVSALIPFRKKRRNIPLNGSGTTTLGLFGYENEAQNELNKPEGKRKAEEAQGNSPPNSFLSLLNGLGIFGTSVLGSLYALVQKEKKATNEALESIKIKLQEKEAAIVSLKKDFESKMLKESEEQTKQLKKTKEEQLSLLDQLNSANNTIAGLGQELKNEKRLMQDLKVQIDTLQSNISKARDEKRSLEQELKEKLDFVDVLQEKVNLFSSELNDKEGNVQKLSSSLAEKESELKNLETTYKKTKEELEKASFEIEGLKEELLRNQSELESKNSTVDELNARISSLTVERDNSRQEFGALLEDYNNLKVASENKIAADAKLLGEREKGIHQLKEKLEIALKSVSENKAIVAYLNKERENLEKELEMESELVKNLKEELLIAEETLAKSKIEASDLFEQLKSSRTHCKELESDISKVRSEFDEAKVRLQGSLDEAKQSGEVLSSELTATKELLKKTRDELQISSHELTSMTENSDSLQRELVDVYKKAETTAHDLKEEKVNVSSLRKELQALEKQISKDKEARKSLETDLEDATKSLDEVNQNILKLSKDLESANAKISGLEDEKMVLYKTLTEQKNTSKEARENMEDAHKLVMSLGKERDSLEKQVKKLEDELASAKGEILRLRSQLNSSEVLVNDKPQQKSKSEAKPKVTVTERKTTRRRKGSSE